MRTRMKPGRFEVTSHVGKGFGCRGRQRQRAFRHQPLDIERAKPDPLEVERHDRPEKRLGFVEQCRARGPVGLLLDNTDKVLNAGFSRLFGVRHRRGRNLPEIEMSINE